MLAGFAQSIYHVQISHSRKASIDITIAGTVSPDSSHWNDQVSRGKAGADGAGSADADGGFHPNVAQLVDTDFCTGSTDASGDTANFSTLISATGGAELSAGHGGIVFLNGKKAGVYRDESGALHPVDIRCPHLGCQLEWDPDEKTWDCPCHGSRFDCLGRLISGPAQTDLDSSLRTGRRSLPPSVERSP